ncbi:MAG: tRNA threonylcarbamoyladenosine dehydratase [Oscillospiraceae bacterium]|nr:tRNA threonylcarbamoyladenosine dehydratase [Oscillospiraceae bacterium]
MTTQFSRTELLLGEAGMARLFCARVAVFGIGSVGGYVVEALARSGVGSLDLIDDDRVCLTNLNHQILATHATVRQYKVDVAQARILEINPNAKVTGHKIFFSPQTERLFNFSQYDYVVDAVDTVTAKLALVELTNRAGVPIISCMGAGNKLDASAFEVADISKTSVCPLTALLEGSQRRQIPGSNAFVPAAAGLILAGEVVRDIAQGQTGKR